MKGEEEDEGRRDMMWILGRRRSGLRAEDIVRAAERRGVQLKYDGFGPFFRVSATAVEDKTTRPISLGYITGFTGNALCAKLLVSSLILSSSRRSSLHALCAPGRDADLQCGNSED